jgi:hypothetical protein
LLVVLSLMELGLTTFQPRTGFAYDLFCLRLALQGPQFPTVANQKLDQILLGLDGFSLLDNQHCHQAVGGQEHDHEQRCESAFFPGSDYRSPIVVPQIRQIPHPLAHSRAYREMQIVSQWQLSRENIE